MGGRLRYADAIALWENMSADTSTYTGMTGMHMVMPLDASAIILSLLSGSTALLGDLAPDSAKTSAKVEVTDEERQAALASMSSLFGFKKE